MAGEWRETTLGDVTEFLSGGTPSKDVPGYWGGSIPWVSAKDMKRFRLDDTEDHLTAHGAPNGGKLVPAGTVLLLVRGMTLLNDLPICVISRDMTFNQDVKALRPKPGTRDDFLPYLLLGNRDRLLRLVDLAGHGTGRLNSDELKALEVVLPPEPEQRAIAHVLGTLDDKIELNRRMNETLEAIARALYKSWFVDFDPVRAKADGRDTALPATIADLFPDAFEDSELGEIPTGWRVTRIADLCSNIFSGGTPDTQSPDFWGGGVPWLSSGETRQRFIVTTERTITEQGVKNSSTRLARAGATVIASAGQGHTRGQTSLLAFDSYVNQSVVVLLADRSRSSDNFLFFDLERRYEQFRQFSDSSSSRGSLTTKLLGGLPAVVPPARLVTAFDRSSSPLVARVVAALRESATLVHLRDTLLPKLISGEVRVKDAERFIDGGA